MSANLYPDDAPKTRRRRRRAPRPKHLPPYIPSATTAPEFDAAAARASVATAPPPPSFGARGGHPALRFHQAKTSPVSAPSTSKTENDDDDDDPDDDEEG